MLLGRAAIYFDEVARRGALRRAADVLHIAPSAVDRQIIQLEEDLGTQLFERTPSGMRMTAAGELLVDCVRRWRRDLQRVRSEIDNLIGLRRGSVSIGLVEGATEFVAAAAVSFKREYPAIQFNMQVYGAQGVVDQVLAGEIDVGLTFNPPDNPTIRLDRTMIYRLGVIVPPEHVLTSRKEISMAECSDFDMVVPSETLSLRRVINNAWARNAGGILHPALEVNSIGLIKSLVIHGAGVGFTTAFDALSEIQKGDLIFIPVSDEKIDLSTLSIVSASGRNLSVPASLLIQHLAQMMEKEGVPTI
jgi:DNA-binding transcriptional LysR family regulator